MFGNNHIPPGFVPDSSRGQDGSSGLARAIGYFAVTGFAALMLYLLSDALSVGLAFLILLVAIVLGAVIMIPVLNRRNRRKKQELRDDG
jgi:sugar phosphate permease